MADHDDLILDIAFGTTRGKNITHWRNEQITWGDVLGWTEGTLPKTKERAGSCFFGRLRPTPEGDHSGTGCADPCDLLHRNNDAVKDRKAFYLDADNSVPDLPDRVEALGAKAMVYTTASSRPEALRHRIIVPTDCRIAPADFPGASRQLEQMLSREGDPPDMWDTTHHQIARLMYKPAAPDPDTFQAWHFDGELIDVPMLLLDAALEQPETADRELAAPEADMSAEVTEKEREKAEGTLAKAVQCAPDLLRPDRSAAPGRNEWVKDWATPLLSLVKGGCLDRQHVEDELWKATLLAPSSGDGEWDRAEFNGVCDNVWKYVVPTRPRDGRPEDHFTPVENDAGRLTTTEHALRIGEAHNPSKPMRNARLLLRRCPPMRWWRGGWYVYRDGVYVPVSDDWVRTVIYYTFEDAYYASGERTHPWDPSPSSVNSTLDALGALSMMEDSAEPDTSRVNLTNGLLAMKTRELGPHSDQVFTVVQLPYAYDETATCPQWLVFLKDVFEGDPDTVTLVQEVFGYIVSGRTDLQKIFYLFGPRRAGKGVVLRVLTALVGDANVASPTVSSYAKDFGLASLIGKTLATTADARFGKSTDIQTVTERWLTISGEDRLSVPRKFRDDWVGTLGARIVIASNETPPFRDSSASVVSRCVVVRFRKSYLGHEDTELANRLLGELPGILNWALDGLDQLDRGRFTEPESSRALAQELEDAASPVTAFVNEKGQVGPDQAVRCSEFIDKFNWWLAEQGSHMMTSTAVGMAVRSAYPKVDRKLRGPRGAQAWYYVGIGFR